MLVLLLLLLFLSSFSFFFPSYVLLFLYLYIHTTHCCVYQYWAPFICHCVEKNETRKRIYREIVFNNLEFFSFSSSVVVLDKHKHIIQYTYNTIHSMLILLLLPLIQFILFIFYLFALLSSCRVIWFLFSLLSNEQIGWISYIFFLFAFDFQMTHINTIGQRVQS